MNIVVVELPAKAKTINKYLGSGYEVLASFGHVRDLPAKDGSVDPNANFRMLWEVDAKSQKRLNDIARAVKDADKLILATDPDREGEAISWHVLEVLKEKNALKKQTVERVVFNAITKQAVTEAMKHPRQIDGALVDAYLARRALDYLVGFTLSPVLWRKLPGARSAGRVQSVALRLVCERELDIEKFVPREYWSILATLATPRGDTFEARLVGADGKKIQRLDVGSGAEAEAFKQALDAADLCRHLGRGQAREAAPAAAVHHLDAAAGGEPQARLRACAHHAHRAAALRRPRDRRRDHRPHYLYAYRRRADRRRGDPGRPPGDRQDYGDRYVPSAPRKYEAKAKNAQEAHEAIRPTDLARRPDETKRYLDADQAKLYELIWLRTVASQMESAELERTTVDITAKAGGRVLDLRANGTVVKFDGFFAVYQEGRDEDPDDEESRRLPEMATGEKLDKRKIDIGQHFTEPPPRYSEASLVKRMEELGIGRPSTYASILQVLKDRKYVRLDKKRLYPEDRGRIVVAFLESYFTKYVEYDFTAGLEEQLDLISNNEVAWRDVLRDFWRDFIGNVDETKDLKLSQVIDVLDAMLGPHLFPPREDGTDPRLCPTCGTGRLGLKLSKFGAFIGCSNYPECRYTRSLAAEGAADTGTKVLGDGSGDRTRSIAAQRPLRPLSPARRANKAAEAEEGREGRACREAQALQPAEGHRARGCHSRQRAQAAVAAARGRAQPRGWRADQGRHRPVRTLRAARQDLRQSRGRRRRAQYRPQPRRDPDRGEEAQGPGQGPLRRRSRARDRRSSLEGRPDRRQERPLRPLCQPRRHQCHAAGGQDAGNHHAR